MTHRLLSEVLPDGSWGGCPCVLVGGGPSLAGFEWERLTGWRVIGVNRAFEKFDPTIIFSMDKRFVGWIEHGEYGQEALTAWRESKALKVCAVMPSAPGVPDYVYVVPLYRSYHQAHHVFTFTSAEGIGHGNNSGYGALNLAVCLKANPIYLLGYDMKHTNGKSHWHGGHPREQRESTVKSFTRDFVRASIPIKRAGFRVVNLNPDSGLKCFEFGKAEEVLRG